VIYVTPSHQFPLGVVMSPRRRVALLEFARTRRALVIEDDYDSEFRYSGRPLDALQTLDRDDSVCYVGTFSKCLFPTLRLGYAVVPPWLRTAYVNAKHQADWHGDVLAQDTLAAFIAEGHLVRHVRHMRKLYAQRRAVLLAALQQYGKGRLRPVAVDAGLHLAASLDASIDTAAWLGRAAAAGINLESLQAYASERSAVNGVAFGLGMVDTMQIEAGVMTLSRLLA